MFCVAIFIFTPCLLSVALGLVSLRLCARYKAFCRIEDAVDVVKLLHVMHSDSELAIEAKDNKLEGQDLLMVSCVDSF